MSTKELVTIGQRWERKRGKRIWEVRQVYRAGYGEVLLRAYDGERITIPLSELRQKYDLLPAASPDGEAA